MVWTGAHRRAARPIGHIQTAIPGRSFAPGTPKARTGASSSVPTYTVPTIRCSARYRWKRFLWALFFGEGGGHDGSAVRVEGRPIKGRLSAGACLFYLGFCVCSFATYLDFDHHHNLSIMPAAITPPAVEGKAQQNGAGLTIAMPQSKRRKVVCFSGKATRQQCILLTS